MPGSLRIVITTFPNARDAARVATHLVTQGLAACANIVPVRSVYVWKGHLENGREAMVFFKVSSSRVRRLKAEIGRRHPYEVPEILELGVESANPEYLRWAEAPRRRGMVTPRE
jgi:periplasmic divalent cation tolerance protein